MVDLERQGPAPEGVSIVANFAGPFCRGSTIVTRQAVRAGCLPGYLRRRRGNRPHPRARRRGQGCPRLTDHGRRQLAGKLEPDGQAAARALSGDRRDSHRLGRRRHRPGRAGAAAPHAAHGGGPVVRCGRTVRSCRRAASSRRPRSSTTSLRSVRPRCTTRRIRSRSRRPARSRTCATSRCRADFSRRGPTRRSAHWAGYRRPAHRAGRGAVEDTMGPARGQASSRRPPPASPSCRSRVWWARTSVR